VGLLDADSVTNFRLVLDNELGVDLFVDLPGGVVGDIEKLTNLIAFVVLEGSTAAAARTRAKVLSHFVVFMRVPPLER
jgi:hypothetical protein